MSEEEEEEEEEEESELELLALRREAGAWASTALGFSAGTHTQAGLHTPYRSTHSHHTGHTATPYRTHTGLYTT